ncbi:hypothetical protein HBZC1_09390 [Helicobacter bizzozeronii CIII-1]|uniref:Uncharacterized protein n=1 Tax=Helicobacter bizzozeronii (strain CIII-1) TaxID=1002804 RepID=F8KSZ1_HELBC|nr:hypothetical protein HBZC1_09390 [Helicobacter bizzozeronii CIII-1]
MVIDLGAILAWILEVLLTCLKDFTTCNGKLYLKACYNPPNI